MLRLYTRDKEYTDMDFATRDNLPFGSAFYHMVTLSKPESFGTFAQYHITKEEQYIYIIESDVNAFIVDSRGGAFSGLWSRWIYPIPYLCHTRGRYCIS